MPLAFAVDDKGHPARPHDRGAGARRRRFVRAYASRPTRSSRRASTCGSARSPIACARASCPGRARTVAERIDELKLHEIDLADGAVLETGCVYIVPLLESLALPDDIAAAANPKSSTGRLDVFTRVIADRDPRLRPDPRRLSRPALCRDQPATFPVLVREGSRLSQIRFRRGHALLDAEALRALHAARAAGRRRRRRRRATASRSASISPGSGRTASSATAPSATPALIDVETPRRLRRRRFLGADPRARGRQSLILDPDEFYILASQGGGAGAARLRRRDGAVRSAGRRIPRALCRLLRSGLRPCRRRRHAARARCWRCARARCRSSSSTARSSAAWSTSRCWSGPRRSTASASARTTRRRA